MNIIPRSLSLLIAVAFAISVIAVQKLPVSAQTSDSDSTKAAVRGIDRIHPGDLIEIDVLGSVEFDWRGKLNPEGFLAGFMIGEKRVFAQCASTEELVLSVRGVVGGILKDPEVVVRILDRSGRTPATIYGAVRNEQRYQIRRGVRLNELLVLSGGLTDQLGGQIRVFRPGNAACEDAGADNEPKFFDINIDDLLSGSDAANISVLSGDIITVNEAFPIYVVGGVNNPRPVLFRENMRLTRAIASAGGLSRDAVAEDIVIIRRAVGKSSTITVNLKAVKAGSAEDVMLERLDIVDVGRRGRERRLSPNSDFAPELVPDIAKMPIRVID